MFREIYIEPDLESSFRENKLGISLFGLIVAFNPKLVLELGALNSFLQALNFLNNNSEFTTVDFFNCPTIFEGNSIERDNIEWIKQYKKKTINSLIEELIKSNVVNKSIPSLSLLIQ